MSDDDNALNDVDLSAWDVPAPEMSADELADGVIARLEGTDVGAAIPVEPGAGGTKKRALLIAGVAAAVIAAVIGGWTIVKGTKRAAPRDGAVVATKAQSIELDGAHADLDAGADVRWKREGNILRVEQRTGSAAWRIGTDSKLVIDAGAAVASVEATGASLRVEVKPMNAADVRLAGALTATAALVAVVVYEGHVKVHDTVTQQTVIVQPGSTYTVQPTPPIVDDEPVVGVAPVNAGDTPEVTIAAGDDVVIHDMAPPTRVRVDSHKVCNDGKPELVVNGVTTSSDMLAFNRGSVTYHVVCDGLDSASGAITVVRDSLVRPLPSPTDKLDTSAPVVSLASITWGPKIVVEGTTLARSAVTVDHVPVPVDGGGRFKVVVSLDDAPRDMVVIGIQTPGAGTQYAIARANTTPVATNAVTVSPAGCDADALKDKGMENVNMGQHAAALQQFEASLRCKQDAQVIALAFMEACNSQNSPKAHLYYRRMSGPEQSRFRVLCIRNHIDPADGGPTSATDNPTTTPASCDADALKDKGMENVNIGQHAAALGQFEASLRCKEDPQVTALAFMAACNAQNAQKARVYYGKLSAADQTRLKVICLRNKIDPFDGNVSVNPLDSRTGVPASCDADALKDKGMEAVNMGEHARALADFEQSLACKNDAYVLSLAFMAACNAQVPAKAKLYYGKLTPTQQKSYKVMCDRNNIDAESGTLYAEPTGTGYLEVTCQPEAKVLIDGKDTGLTTPVKGKKLPLEAGKHKLTLVVGDDRFTYPAKIEPGKTLKMSKDLR